MLDNAALTTAAKDTQLIVQIHALRILAERKDLTPDQFQQLRTATSAPDGLVPPVAAEALGRHPNADSQKALLDLREQSGTAVDQFLSYAVRLALRNNIRAGTAWQVRTNADVDALSDVALAVPDSVAAMHIANQLWSLDARQQSRMPSYVYHVGRYATFDNIRGALVDYFQAKTVADPALAVQLLEAILHAAQEPR